MSFYEDDFYNEPSEFDMMVSEFKDALIKSVKDEYVSEMERLKKENESLQEVKADFETIKATYATKKHQLEIERNDLARKVRNERLSVLMKDFEVIMYKVGSTYEKPPKCDKCDKSRRIKYTTPLGKEAFEKCSCDVSKIIYIPEEYQCSEFSINHDKNGMTAHYKMTAERDYDYMSSTHCKITYNNDMKYEDVLQYNTFFKTKVECQGYCDYLNTKE